MEGEGEVHSAQPTHEGTKKAVVVRCNGGRLQIGGGVDVCVCACVCEGRGGMCVVRSSHV